MGIAMLCSWWMDRRDNGRLWRRQMHFLYLPYRNGSPKHDSDNRPVYYYGVGHGTKCIRCPQGTENPLCLSGQDRPGTRPDCWISINSIWEWMILSFRMGGCQSVWSFCPRCLHSGGSIMISGSARYIRWRRLSRGDYPMHWHYPVF